MHKCSDLLRAIWETVLLRCWVNNVDFGKNLYAYLNWGKKFFQNFLENLPGVNFFHICSFSFFAPRTQIILRNKIPNQLLMADPSKGSPYMMDSGAACKKHRALQLLMSKPKIYFKKFSNKWSLYIQKISNLVLPTTIKWH